LCGGKINFRYLYIKIKIMSKEMREQINKVMNWRQFNENSSVFDEFMLEWKVFINGEWKESNTLIKKTLKEINNFIDENNLTMYDNDYRIKGWRNGKWETLVSKIK
jgi:hypothetical protein